MQTKQKAVGVFDSGLGGLTVVRSITELMPCENVIYFGDTGRVPYGTKSPKTILRYAQSDVAFLEKYDIKAVVIACNTADSIAGDEIRKSCDKPVCGVVYPASLRAAAHTKNNRIGLIGTSATIKSGVYEKYISEVNPQARVISQACPLFVPLVENGRFKPGDEVVKIITAEYLKPIKDAGADVLILGCTHYPLLWEVIEKEMPGVEIISSSDCAALALVDVLRENDLLNASGERGKMRYFVSDDAQSFDKYALMFMGRELMSHAEQVEIE